jgi:hypothetical protein
MRRADRITIMSAYYSVMFLEEVLDKVLKTKRNKCKLELIFNGFSGQRLHDQIQELKNLKLTLKALGFRNISILINRETTLFHTKLYFISNEKGSLWFSGSANASVAAFGKNEELLIKATTNIKAVKRYISNVIENSKAIEDINIKEITESNIIGFFRTGSIYFKPNNKISFTFSELNFPGWVEDKLTEVLDRPKNTNPGKAWGAYNLKLSLGLKEDEETEQKTRLSLKPWSVETCFGYWVPNKYRVVVNKNISEKSKNSKTKLEYLLNLLKQRGAESILSDYRLYLSDVRRILDANDINWQIDEINLVDKFKKFTDRIITKLSNPCKLDKVCMPLVSTGMPEIWEDNLAYDDFSESFFEYISGCLSEQLPLIVKSLKERIKFERGDDSEAVGKHFLEYFDSDDAEWSDDYWF